MDKDSTIKYTEERLKSVPDIKKSISDIDIELKSGKCNAAEAYKLKNKKKFLNNRLKKTIDAVCTLEDTYQKIICYKYFEKMNYKTIATNVGCHYTKVSRNLSKIVLLVGRELYGLEDEEFNKLL